MFGYLATKAVIELINEARWRLFPRKVSRDEVKFLETHFKYYSRLKPQHKKEFIDKLEMILSTKRLIARGGLEEITWEMEILVGATIAMVTFGWKRLKLAHFHTILIYPNPYFSTINKIYHRGEVNPKHGLIILSWQSFVEGYADFEDGVNLGIHEIAHALKLANQIDTDGEREFDPKSFAEYKKWVPIEMEKVKAGAETIFRERAAFNEHEFFAIIVEAFFEKSQEFKAYNPEFYQAVVHLLRQDPLVLQKAIE